MSEAMKESGKFKKKALGKGLKDLEQKEPDGEGVKELFGEDDNKKQIDKETSEMNDEDLKETYDALERKDNSYEANKIREEYDKRYGKQQQDDYTPSDEEIGFNPREAVDYYLKKGDFEKADELINDYALEDERDEFIEGQRPLVRSDYYKHRKQAELTDKARDQIVNGYDDYDYAIRNFADDNKITTRQAEEYFELAGNKLGIKPERVTGEDDKQSKALGKGLDDLGKEKLDGEGAKKLFDDNSSETEKDYQKYNKWLKDQGVDKQLTEEEYNKMSQETEKINNKGLERSIEMEKDNLARRKQNGDSVENISNKTRNIHELELEKQKSDQRLARLNNTNETMNDVLRRKAYQKYLKEHPASKMTFNEFKKEQK